MKRHGRKARLQLIAIAILALSALRAPAEEKEEPKYTQAQIKELCFKLSSNDDDVRWDAAKKLIEAGSQSTEMLSRILVGEWLEGRKLAAYLLGEIKDPAAVLPLASCLGDSEFHVRWKCAVSLKAIGKPSVISLSQVLRTGNLNAQYCAAWTLGEIKDPRATLALAETATSDDYHLRWKSTISLKRIGRPAVEELKRLLKDDRVKARRCAVWALDQLGGKAAADLLLDAIADPDDEVRCRAAAALSKYDRADVRTALEGLVEDKSAAVRRQAVISIAKLGRQIVPGDEAPGNGRVAKWGLYEVVHRHDGALPAAPEAAMEVRFLTPSQGSRVVRGFRAGDNT